VYRRFSSTPGGLSPHSNSLESCCLRSARRVETVDPWVWRVPLSEPCLHLSMHTALHLWGCLVVYSGIGSIRMPSISPSVPETVSLPLSFQFSHVFPLLMLWLIQNTLAAQPITGKRWVLWRLRRHTGGMTQHIYQLRRSCVSA
jgi:hypothetical protein